MEAKIVIYFDHAATTPLDSEVFEKMRPYFTEHYGNADSLHAYGRKAQSAVDDARDRLASLLNASPKEIYFTSGGTESDNWAILGVADGLKARGRTEVLLSAIEHHAVLAAGERLRAAGFCVRFLPVNAEGVVEPTVLENALTDRTGLVGVMAANNETGVIQPVRKLSERAHARGALFFTDTVQAAPYLPVDVRAWGADLLSLSAHKFYGPKGVGALYVKSGVRMNGLVTGGEQERGLRGGTLNVAGAVGLACAYEKTVRERAQNNARISLLTDGLYTRLSELGGVSRNGGGERLPSVLNVRFEEVENTAFLLNMDLQGVAISAGAACASASTKPSHVLLAMGKSEKEARESVRFSLGKGNDEKEVERAAEIAKETVSRLRSL